VGDLSTDEALVKQCADGVDVVVHLAGANEVAIAEDAEAAVADTLAAAEQVVGSGVGRIIYLSTVHVYGAALAEGAVVSESTVPQPTHPYGASRLACEEVFWRSGVPTLVFRLTNGVGAPTRPDVDRWSLVANELCREGALLGRVTLRTPGAQWRDFVALRDVEAGLSALVRGVSGDGDGVGGGAGAFPTRVYNLGSGTSVTVRTLAGMVQDSFVAAGEPRPELVAPPLPADPPGPYRVDVSRLAELGLVEHTPLQVAIDETVRFCLEHREELR
jgi:UDP-glucose 4-epimerase